MKTLNSMFFRFMDEYASELSAAKKDNNFKRPFAELIRKEIPDYLQKYVDSSIYEISRGVGTGRWRNVQFITVLDKRITTTSKKGEYIVYLLNKDSKTLYLTFNQGTENKRIDDLKANAIRLQNQLTIPNGATTEKIDSGDKSYDAGCVFSKAYRIDTLPQDEELISDLKAFIEVYKSYYLSLNKSGDGYSGQEETGNVNIDLSTKELIQHIKKYIASQGFTYDDSLIKNFYLSLKSKPFVILAGTSGTGKTKLVQWFAEAIGAYYKLVSVRPDWSDGSDLFGHVNLSGELVPGPVCDCFKYANGHRNKPVFLCLDEMNLARVEYYFSDFLSVIESRKRENNGNIVTGPIAQFKDGIPDNLYIIGTVNMDETTFPFSKKVLDRANTIEFNYVDLTPKFNSTPEIIEKLDLDNSVLRTDHLVLLNDCVDEKEYVSKICKWLQDLNEKLSLANEHIGYRVRDEIVFYMLNNKRAGMLIENELEAFDYEILQKILPRIQGSSAAIKNLLIDLFIYCGNNIPKLDKNGTGLGTQMENLVSTTVYPQSAKKIAYMMKRYEEDGFTSYWL